MSDDQLYVTAALILAFAWYRVSGSGNARVVKSPHDTDASLLTNNDGTRQIRVQEYLKGAATGNWLGYFRNAQTRGHIPHPTIDF